MIKRRLTLFLIIAALLLPNTAMAWNWTGHEVVARIAWDNMKPQTRQRVIALMLQAPADSDLPGLLPADNRPLQLRQRELFVIAATWPDIVRDREKPARMEKYHHSIWHYTNFFWRQQSGVAVDVPELQPENINIVERLGFLQGDFIDMTRPASERGIDVAWILHLIGDIHQPLHTSARVTDMEPKGDQGGNLFLLTPTDTPAKDTKRLHGFWDDILMTSVSRRPTESDMAYVNRIASIIMQRYPKTRMKKRLKLGEYAAWAKEGLTTAKTTVYPPSLKRSEKPTETYRKQAYSIAQPAIALAGYRLAATLDKLLGQ